MTGLFTRTMRSGLSLLEIQARVQSDRFMGPDLPVMKLAPEGTPQVNLVYADMARAKAASPDAAYAYTTAMMMATRDDRRQEGPRNARDLVAVVSTEYFDAYKLAVAEGSLFGASDELGRKTRRPRRQAGGAPLPGDGPPRQDDEDPRPRLHRGGSPRAGR
jgi:hypothetical protein